MKKIDIAKTRKANEIEPKVKIRVKIRFSCDQQERKASFGFGVVVMIIPEGNLKRAVAVEFGLILPNLSGSLYFMQIPSSCNTAPQSQSSWQEFPQASISNEITK